MSTMRSNILWCKSALLDYGWAEAVEIEVDARGDISKVTANQSYRSGDKLMASVVPGIPNLHSHAQQRAMAGLAERAGLTSAERADSFWSWREVMYRYLERMDPEALYHIARQLYVEMLKAGYTSVAEFQYVHHDSAGQPYANPAEMSLQCTHAATETGLGMTILPVLYRYSGFGGIEPQESQRRFLNDASAYDQIFSRLDTATALDPNAHCGMALHSLRAVDQPLIREILSLRPPQSGVPIHIHIAEQKEEVEQCLAWSGQRPIEWLFNHCDVGPDWCLVHATHALDTEIMAMASSQCVVGLCPSTEANLGDGIFSLSDLAAQSGRWGIGSDSHISISPVEELRWLEYGQRLTSGTRNVAASHERPSTGRQLLESALAGGAQACGRKLGAIAPGFRADLVALDDKHPRLYGRSGDSLLDSWIFSGNQRLITDVYVGGIKRIDSGKHEQEDSIALHYRKTIDRLAAN
ncbi:MAG: formimidoylglutamate deiminase [Halieaceae bacterium]|jgi:formimidoylglutamate deiminase